MMEHLHKTRKPPSDPFKSCISQTNPGAREIKLYHYGRALEAAFIRRNKWAALFRRLQKSQTILSYIHIFTASPSTTQTQAQARVSPLFGGTAEGGSKWKENGKKDQQNEQLHLFNQVQSERERGNRTNYWLRSGQEAELSVPSQVLIKMPLSLWKKERKQSQSKQAGSTAAFVWWRGEFGGL